MSATQPAPAGVDAAPPPGARRALTFLALAMFLGMATWFSASAVVPQLSAVLSLRGSSAAWLTLGVQVGFVGGALAMATSSAADRFGPRQLMCAGAAAAAGANLLLLVVDSGWQAVAVRILTGASLAAVYPPGMKAVSTWFRTSRATATAVMIAALTLGSALPHLIAAVTQLDWRLVVISTSVISLAGAAAALLAGDGPFPFASHPFRLREALEAFRSRAVLTTTCGYLGHMWELYAMWSWFALFMGAVLADDDRSPGWASLLTFLAVGVGALGCLAGGLMAARIGSARSAMWAMVLSGVCAAAIGWLVDGPVWLVVAVGLVWGFWVIADSAQFSTLVTLVADQRYVGSVLTLQMALGYLVTVPIGWLVPAVVDRAGWGVALLCVAAGPAVGALAMRRVAVLVPRAGAGPTAR